MQKNKVSERNTAHHGHGRQITRADIT